MNREKQLGQTVVLLAEDEPMVRNMIRVILTAGGYQVLDVPDGRQAIELSRQYQGDIDLLLTDLKMPHVDGAKAAEIISTERPGIRVLIISGHASDEIRKEAITQAFLRKPFAPSQLREKIREVLEQPPAMR